ncbi:outer membrane beta-barrel protein [Portibacter marinus]|uniref:outer membrane beta-barrel protein n=1 Tax=Portibacter marinus TaxID=2898660 RepID=UPI001F1DDED7|nr:outer membrane beta-barrel protein [Portibacter marinus]
MKKIVALLLFLASATLMSAQGGAQIFTGITTLTNTSTAITRKGEFHSGFTVGIQSRLKDGTFVAGPGLKYTRFNMVSSNEAGFYKKEENYHLLSVPFNIGLEYRLTYILKLRMYTGADAHYFYKIDENDRSINLDYVNDYFFGAHAGIGIDLYWVTFDAKYEYGLSNAHKMDRSKYNALNFNVGIFF